MNEAIEQSQEKRANALPPPPHQTGGYTFKNRFRDFWLKSFEIVVAQGEIFFLQGQELQLQFHGNVKL